MDSCRKHLAAKRDPDLTAFAAFAPPPSNKTSNKTFPGSLVPWPRLPRFVNFPFHFPFRGEKGSAPRGRRKRGEGAANLYEALAVEAGPLFIGPPQKKSRPTCTRKAMGGRGPAVFISLPQAEFPADLAT